jgi:N-acetylmuramoyl-L-alanine amidase/putative methionine-R-sulfoxide reductase with GAF domain
MATTPTKPDHEVTTAFTGTDVPAWPRGQGASPQDSATQKPSQRDALQALLAFSSLHEQVRRRKALATRHNGFDVGVLDPEFDRDERFVLDEVLQLVAERAIAITGADGLAIALAENNEIVLRASAGTVKPDVGARIDRDSAFSGACFRTAEIVNCDDTEVDPRVNVVACRKLGARSMVAVPLCGRRRVIGVLEAFSSWPFGFNDSDVRNLSLLAELVLGALRPEDEDRFAQSAQVAATKLDVPRAVTPPASAPVTVVTPTAPIAKVAPPVPVVAKPAGPETKAAPAPVGPPKPVQPQATLVAPPAPHAPVVAKPVAAEIKSAPAPIAPVAPVKTVPPQIAPVTPAKLVPSSVAPVIAAAPAAPVATKPVAPEIKSAPAILDKAAPAPEKIVEKIPAAAEAVAADTSAASELTFGQQPEKATRPVMLILLVAIVIATAFAGGIWWRWKASQLGSVMVTNETIQQDKPAPKPAEPGAVTNATAPPNPAANPTTTATPDTSTETNAPVSAPATPQELSKFPRVTGIRHWSSADTSTVVLDLEDQVQYEPGHLTNPDRVYFDLRDTQLVPELQGKSIDVGDTLLSRIRTAQPVPGMTRVVLEARGGATLSRPQVSLERDPYRLVIQVTKAGATPKGAVNLFPNAAEAQKRKLAIVVPPPTREDLQLRSRVPKMRIVVDAGHGGWDLGTVGRRGLLEKDLVLEIAQRLGKLLETRLGSEVIYTRQDDNYIPLDDRATIANNAQADLFVSVHANYSDLPSARGVETYYTNFFSAPGLKETSSTDPHFSGAKPATTPNLTAADLRERIEQSRRLATSVQRSLYGVLSAQNSGLRDRGIKEAGFVVLTESAMPGILAEVSFVSSPTDEQKLRSDGYREQIAEALYKGIARYAASSRGVKVASAGK